jgi:hypothetical protein
MTIICRSATLDQVTYQLPSQLTMPVPQCDALQQTVSSLEGTLMLRVKELNETYEDLDTMRSDLRIAEVSCRQ